METLKNFAAGLLGLIFFAALGLAAAFYINAAAVGLNEAFGWDGWWVIALLVLMVTMRVGLFTVICFGAYGAFSGWGWDWWLVLIVFFPFVILSVAGGLVAAIYGALQMMIGRSRRADGL